MSLTSYAVYRNKSKKINATQYTSIKAHSYKVLMYLQKLHYFRNTHTPDDGRRLDRKYKGNN